MREVILREHPADLGLRFHNKNWNCHKTFIVASHVVSRMPPFAGQHCCFVGPLPTTKFFIPQGRDWDMPPSATIDDQIRGFLLRTFPTARKTGLQNDTLLLEGGVIDSLGTLNIVEFLESSFNIRIADDDLVPENFASIDHLSAFTRKKLEQPRTISL